MEPERSAPSSPCLDVQPLPAELHETNTEFGEESIIYSDIRFHCSSSIQKRKITRIFKTKVSPWCIATVVFACLYLIVLVQAAIMTAKVQCLEGILKAQGISDQNETGYCRVI
ncbi:hypothetical protein MUG91_G461n4 [Manis pentadactyla]|nr:hypothetical protein MUG91_G461n4 [Manis pentadactyla]